MKIQSQAFTSPSPCRFEDLTFRRPDDEAAAAAMSGPTGLIEALVFEVGDRNQIGYLSSSGMRAFCCTPELVERTGCQAGRIIIRPRDGTNQVSTGWAEGEGRDTCRGL